MMTMNEVLTVSPADVRAWEMNPRKRFDQKKHEELVSSMRSIGFLGAITVRHRRDEPEKFEVIAGERRWRAAKAAGLPSIRVEVRELDDRAAIELAMLENLEREDLDIVEEAEGYQAMVKLGWGVKEISERSGRAERVIYMLLELVRLDEKTLVELRDGTISQHVAEALGKIEDIDARAEALERIVTPKTQDVPLARERALRLIKEEYLAPQKRAQKWEKRGPALQKQFPKAKVIGIKEVGQYLRAGSGWEKADERPEEYLLAVHMRGKEVPTWGELAEKHGGEMVLVPDAEGEPIELVNGQAIRSGELVAGEKDPEACIFPLSTRDGRHEQSMAKQQDDSAAEHEWREEMVRRREIHEKLTREIHRALCHPVEKLHDEDLKEFLKMSTGWMFDHELIEDFEDAMALMAVDAETMGEGDSKVGAKAWAMKVVDERGVNGFAAVWLMWCVSIFDRGGDRFHEYLEPIRSALGVEADE